MATDAEPPAARRALLHHALACLRRTTASLNLTYPNPSDAWAHYDELRRVMAPWLQSANGFRRHGASGYSGPWIENVWISHFERLAERARARRRGLHTVFGPYVPLLLPFTDHWVRDGGPAGYRYPIGFLTALRSVLRPRVPYIAVSQNDEGLTGKDELPMSSIPNVLVLSAGGYGHVPVPLLKQPEPPQPASAIRNRRLLVSYVGSLGNAPAALRARMKSTLADVSAELSFEYLVAQGLSARWSALMLPLVVERAVSYLAGKPSWRDVMANSRASLCPRGYGRSSYHLGETVQMGRVPVYVYSDTAWVPYERLFRRSVGYVSSIADLPLLLHRLFNVTHDELERRERRAAALRASHFTLPGVMLQISRFMLEPWDADLQCQRLPPSLRDA